MPRPNSVYPKLCHHKGTNQALVYVGGKQHYLGVYGSPKAKLAYAALLSRLKAGLSPFEDQQEPAEKAKPVQNRSVAALLHQFIIEALPKYAVDEQHCQKGAIRIVNELFGAIPAAEFGPLKLRLVRDAMIAKGWSRSYINRSVKRVRHIFRWGVSWEFVPESVANALGTVECLKAGETDAPESKPRRAVSPERIAAVRAELNQRHRDIFDLLLLTGARPGELIGLTTGVIDRSGEVWRVDLARHKTAHKGKHRVLFFNATAQAILQKYLSADPQKRLFPIRRDNYGQAVKKACERAFGMPDELRNPDVTLPPAMLAEVKRQAKAWRQEHVFTPHWLRHTVATRLADELGVEHAQRLLGHANAAMTEHYSRAAEKIAIGAAKTLG